MSVGMLYVIFLIIKPLGIKTSDDNSASKSNATTMRHETLNCKNEYYTAFDQ
jgi:hypothetical protein